MNFDEFKTLVSKIAVPGSWEFSTESFNHDYHDEYSYVSYIAEQEEYAVEVHYYGDGKVQWELFWNPGYLDTCILVTNTTLKGCFEAAVKRVSEHYESEKKMNTLILKALHNTCNF